MRPWSFLLLLLNAPFLHAQLLINELQCTRVAGSDGHGPNGDWVELHHAKSDTLDLEGHALVLQARTAYLPKGLRIAPQGRVVLWCGKANGHAPDHIGLDLPRAGGTLLLVAPDRSTVLDVFHWPALPAGVSIGRKQDGGRAWGYFAAPTPGGPNGAACSHVLEAPGLRSGEQGLVLAHALEGTVHYTVDGADPGPEDSILRQPLQLPPGSVVRARSFAQDAVPGPVACHTVGLAEEAWGLIIAEQDLHGPLGITDTATGNHARKGRAWQRQAWLQRADVVLPIGLAVAGSGSRSLPKRNFKVLVRDRFKGKEAVPLPDGTAWRNVVLRADASPHAFLRNSFMEEVARRSGNRVDVQPGVPLPLYLNGRYQGLYRAMPAKGEEWVRRLNGDQAVELIEGPAGHVVQGDDQHYRKLLHALLAGTPSDTIARMADLSSLVELACFDLWTGRADHELNVRCWRPAQAGGRWRWVMYDMDQWAPPADRTLARMCGAAMPEAPYLPQLLADPGSRALLLARMAALGATTLSTDRAKAVADSIYARHRPAMVRDQLRWKDEMPSPDPETVYQELVAHIAERNAHLFGQLSGRTGHALRTLSLHVEPADAGSVYMEDLHVTSSARTMQVFADVPLHLQAIPATGMEFAGWKGLEAEGERAVCSPRRNMRVTALFRPAGLSRQGGL